MLVSPHLPTWLQGLLGGEKFFNACLIHQYDKKNEKNIFCLDCAISICPHCLHYHRSHRLLQVRRYVYRDVILLVDAQKLMDCAFVQSYTTNSAKVVFLNQRQTRSCKASGNNCKHCQRALQDPYLFCSLSCKIHHLIRTEGVRSVISEHLYECGYLPFPEPVREGFGDSDSVLEPAGSARTSSESGGSGVAGAVAGGDWCRTSLACTAATDFIVRKKRSCLPAYRAAAAATTACRPAVGSPSSDGVASRRKGTPHRSPLY